MPLAVLRKIRDLVNAGAVVVGPEAHRLARAWRTTQAEFKTIADQLWGPARLGKGKVLRRRDDRRGAGRAEGRAGLRVHEAAGRHRVSRSCTASWPTATSTG